MTRDEVLGHIAEIVAATTLPVNADFQSGYAPDPVGVEENVGLCIETGVAGLSIEDSTGDIDRPLYELSDAVDRVLAARVAIDSSGSGVLLTARAECYLTGHPDPLRESIRRLQAYSDAGADVLYAPGPRDPDDISTIVRSVSPKPTNVLMSSATGLNVRGLADLGVRRISVGSALARVAWGSFLRAAKQIAEEGSFAGLGQLASFSELNALFRDDSQTV